MSRSDHFVRTQLEIKYEQLQLYYTQRVDRWGEQNKITQYISRAISALARLLQRWSMQKQNVKGVLTDFSRFIVADYEAARLMNEVVALLGPLVEAPEEVKHHARLRPPSQSKDGRMRFFRRRRTATPVSRPVSQNVADGEETETDDDQQISCV